MPSSATPGSTDGVVRGVLCPEPRFAGGDVGLGVDVGLGGVVGTAVGAAVGAFVGSGVGVTWFVYELGLVGSGVSSTWLL